MYQQEYSRLSSDGYRSSGGPARNDRDRGSYGSRGYNDYGRRDSSNSRGGSRGFNDYGRRDSSSSRGGDFRGGRGGGYRGGRGGFGTGRQQADDAETLQLGADARRCTMEEVNNYPAIREVKSMNVEANGYELDAGRAKVAYQYDILWTGEFKNGKKKNINVCPKGDIKMNIKQEAITSLFNQLLRENDAFFKASECREKYAYDTGSIFFSQNKLMEELERRVFELDVANLDQKAKDYFRRIVNISAEVRLTREIRPNFLNGDLENDRPAIQYLEVVFNQEQRNGGKYLCFNNKFFDIESNDPIEQTCLTLKSGVTRSIRLIGDPAEKKLMVQMIPTKTAFYERGDLVFLIQDAIRTDIRNVYHGQNFEKAHAAVKNLTVKTTHLQSNRLFVAAGLSENPANREFFEYDGKQVSIAEYYAIKYKMNLRYPELPCVIEKKGKDLSHYPIEVVEVPANQRIPKAKQNTDLNSKIIRKCQTLPAAGKTLIEHYRAEGEIANSNDFIKNTGVRVVPTKLISAPAKQLAPPAIVFKTNQKKLKSGVFGMQQGDQFAVGGEVRKLAVINGSREDVRSFIDQFINRLGSYGVSVVRPEIIDLRGDIERTLAQLARDGFDFALVIGDPDDLHNGMKHAELSTRMITQHIRSQTLRKANNSLFDNLAFKFNLKAGGLNWGIGSDPNMIMQCGNVDLLKSLTDNTLFIGIDLSHPLGRPEDGAPYDQVDPTCVGFASNISRGNTNMEHGDYGFQFAQKTLVDPKLLEAKFGAAIMTYYRKNGLFPSWIVVYRVGMSEAEVAKVRNEEVPVMKKVLEEIRSQFPELSAAVKLTVVMANRNSTLRIFNEVIDGYAKAPVQNVPSGTCVFQKIVSSGGGAVSFIMVAQRALIGTARPTIYHVLEGADCVKMEHIQFLTYALCYTHAIVTSPTALPGPLVSAADLSKRGRNNFKQRRLRGPALPVDDENANVAKHRQAQGDTLTDEEKQRLKDAEDRYFGQLSTLLHPGIEEKRFWA